MKIIAFIALNVGYRMILSKLATIFGIQNNEYEMTAMGNEKIQL